MSIFMCTECKYTLDADVPPEKCPSCGNACSFVDAACYTPECGGTTKNINPDIYKNKK
jgi:rubredoxin